jgi:hypothetical protein
VMAISRLLVIGATAVIRFARQDNASKSWAARPLERKPARLVSVALANKTARMAGRSSRVTSAIRLRPYSRSPQPASLTPAEGSARVVRSDYEPVEPGTG